MAQEPDETALVRMLVATWHLNVPERRALPEGKAKASLVLGFIELELRAHGWFPPTWRPEVEFNGGLIELRPDGTCRIHWKAEVSMARCETVAIEEHETVRDAVLAFARQSYGDDIDGVPIDWGR
jgi:hypothetical protein